MVQALVFEGGHHAAAITASLGQYVCQCTKQQLSCSGILGGRRGMNTCLSCDCHMLTSAIPPILCLKVV